MKTKMLLALMLLAAPLLQAGDELAAGAKAPAFSLVNARIVSTAIR